MAGDPSIDLSVVILNYNVKHFTEQCLRSLAKATKGLTCETFVVDNGSDDGSVVYLKERFPEVHFIVNQDNLGFARGNNLALRVAQGKYLLILNPDTIVEENALHCLIAYLNTHPQVGAVGPKILDRYGRFDHASRRGFPTPWASFTRFVGLSKIFPHSRLFARYELSYLNPDEPASIDALSGACMIVRREVYLQTAGFDEDYFMYGEDIDWSYRIKQAGWEVHYVPQARIIHFRGESIRRSLIDRERAFYGAMVLFIEKHFSHRYPWLVYQGLVTAVLGAEALARLKKILQRGWAPLVDMFAIAGTMVIARILRWGEAGLSVPVVFSLIIQSLTYLAALSLFGVYSSRKGEMRPLMLGMGLGFTINGTFTLFFKQFAYSRFVTLFTLLGGLLVIWGWRKLVTIFYHSSWGRSALARRVVIVGTGEFARRILKILLSPGRVPLSVVGIIDPQRSEVGKLIDGVPVLGTDEELGKIAPQENVEEVIFALEELDYHRIVDIMIRSQLGKRVEFRVINPKDADSEDLLRAHLLLDHHPSAPVLRAIRRLALTSLRSL